MRLELRFIQTKQHKNKRHRPNKHAIQGMIYQALKNTEFERIHDTHHTKPFSFSDWFHSRRNGGNRNWMFISSPEKEIIKTLNDHFRPRINQFKILDYQLVDVIPFQMKDTRYLKTASPIVLTRDGELPYHSFKERTMGLTDFEQYVIDTATRQYQGYTGNEDFHIEGPLFEQMDLRKEIPVPVDIGGSEFIIIGSTWHKLVLVKDRSRKPFYNWLKEMGIGQKTSLGFGFIQPFQMSSKNSHYYTG